MFAKGTLLCLVLILHIHQSVNLCIELERQVLLKIGKDIYDPDDWFSSWRKGGNCCNWQGITCHNTTGHVISLDLHYPDLLVDHDEMPGKSKLNLSLVDLKHLIYLNLSHNNFAGASIPTFIGSLTHLEYLDLSDSEFQGTIPSQLGNLSSLIVLNMEDMFGLRVDGLHWLSRLTSLTSLHMSGVNLSTAVDWFDDITKLPFIAAISLTECFLPGIPMIMPPFNNFTFLQTFNLGGNELNSTIRGWLFNNISSLESLSLNDCGLYGELPPLSGKVSNLKFLDLESNDIKLGDFLHFDMLPLLTELNLMFNNINASISETLWNLRNLTHLTNLKLSYNHFHGSLPKTLGNYSQFETLDLSTNYVAGEIPHSIGNLCRLTGLDLSRNNIGGEVPHSIGNLYSLTDLFLSYNNIRGEIPHSIRNLLKLTRLDLGSNNIGGEIPYSIGNLYSLTDLNMERNNIEGEIPRNVGNLYSLRYFNIERNNIGGEIPHSIGNLFNLTYLELSNNNIEGKIPDSIGNLKKLWLFNVTKNRLSKEIPHSLFNLSNLFYLILAGNSFCGDVPKSININGLAYVDFSNNRLNGSIFFSNQGSLRELNLSNNSFTGMFPFSGSITSQLQVVNLSNNSFSGAIPNLFMFHPLLTTLQLDKNNFKGLIPSSLKHCKLLRFLDLSENKLCGKIPPWIGGTLLALKVLNLRSNNFTGQIPRELSRLTSLQILDLSHNHLTGNFSLYFGNFTVMTKEKNTDTSEFTPSLNLSIYSEDIWLNKQGVARQYTTTIAYAIYVDVSSNEISGEISNGITKLVGLKLLNMSRNHFIGNIPKNISAIKDLEELDLSSNELSGEIPSTMAELSYLHTLNLSYNELYGMIPIGNQFQTFDPSTYIGNNNLCGWPLPKCFKTNINNTTDFDGEENEEYECWYEKTWINVGTVVGFLVSSWGIFITLLFSNSMRRLYFYYVDKLYGLITLQLQVGINKIKSKIMETEMR